MKKLALAAGVLCALASAPASAADLDYDRGPIDRRSYVYEDPRYADIYGEPRRAPAPYYEERIAPPYAAPPYADPDRRYAGRPEHCAAKDEIRERLSADGWRDFHNPEVQGPFALLSARRGGGDLYRLKVDRCTGAVLSAQIIERGRDSYGPYGPYGSYGPGYGPSYGPYAYGEPRRWPRAY